MLTLVDRSRSFIGDRALCEVGAWTRLSRDICFPAHLQVRDGNADVSRGETACKFLRVASSRARAAILSPRI